MQTSLTKLLTMLALCNAAALGACAIDDTSTGDDPGSDDSGTTITRDPLTGQDQLSIVMPNGISINLPVVQWQRDLNVLPFCPPRLAEDGQFGTMTRNVTVCFQQRYGLQANGDVGRITLGAMCAALTEFNQVSLRNATNCTQ
jgi:peptidoglycan hydrolase-like protein with peptidoglycan-binding domain